MSVGGKASVEVPQADNLARVRLVVQAIGDGERDSTAIARKLGVTERNVAYAAQAARALSLLDGSTRTPLGDELCRATPGGEAERACLRRAVAESAVLRAVAPGLLDEPGPSPASLAAQIAEATGLAPATAERRAQTLLSWREQLADRQGNLLG